MRNGFVVTLVIRMRAWSQCLALALIGMACTAAHAQQQSSGKTSYKWVDEHGVTHYGDRIPPQYAKSESSVLNKHGVEVGRNDAQKTPEQVAEEARLHELAVRQKQHDRFLITTYPSVKDIEALRDERLGQISAQRRAAEAYIDGLYSRLSALQTRAFNFKPYNDKANARRMPDDLAEDLMRTINEMRSQRTALVAKDAEETALREQFQADIVRYKELRSVRSQR